MTRLRPVIVILAIAAAAYAGLCLLVFLFQDRLVYFPGPPPTITPMAHGLEYRELELALSDDATVHGWYMPAENAPDNANGALLFCHGNAGNIENRLYSSRIFHEMGLAVLLFDYRGYGKSSGRPNEEARIATPRPRTTFSSARASLPSASSCTVNRSAGA